MPQLDAVLPLTLADVERARLLFRTLSRIEALGTLWVIAPDDECERIAAGLPTGSREIVPESRLAPELPLFRARFDRHEGGDRRKWGWRVQQILKLAAASVVRTPFYLTLDADVLCLRPVRYDDLVRNGRAIHVRFSREVHPDWYLWAERVLGMPRSGLEHGVTPAILSVEGVRALQRHLQRRVAPGLRAVGALLPRSATREALSSWRAYLLRNAPFTEYALYGTFLEASGLYERYHVPVGERAIYANCVWYVEDFEAWNPADAVALGDAWFTVVQSNTGIAPERVAEKLRGLIPAET